MTDLDEAADEVVSTLAVVIVGRGRADTERLDPTRWRTPSDVGLDVERAVEGDSAGATRNRAVRSTKGSYLALIDATATPDPDWLATGVAALRADPSLGAVTVGTAAGSDPGGWLLDPPHGALVMRRTAWDAAGGFDEEIEEAALGLDLGWRMWLLGWRVQAVDGLVVDLPVPSDPRSTDLERIAGRHLARSGRLAAPRHRLTRRTGPPSRAALARARRRPDVELGVLIRRASERRVGALVGVLEAAGAARCLAGRCRVVVATADTLAPTMAGPGIRAWRIASALAPHHDVHLVTTGLCEISSPDFAVEGVDADRFHELVQDADVLVFQGWVLADKAWITRSGVIVVADIYAPMHLEQLEQGRDALHEGGRWLAVSGANEAVNNQLRRGDLFLCASAKQRDLWLGQFASVGRVNPVLYDEDTSFTARLPIVPFGVDDEDPVQRRRAIKGSVEGIEPEDEVILWGGGIYNWFDPLTLIRAVDELRERRPRLRLYFLGTKHPNPEIPEMRMSVAARALAGELGLLHRHVFFNDGWVPFDERADYLLDADVAVSIHLQHVETEFSFRTRVLDYLWAGLPVVATSGDSFARIIEAEQVGLIVGPGDVPGLVSALERLLGDDGLRAACAENSRRLAHTMRWSKVLAPLVDFCAEPKRAPDIACPDIAEAFGLTTAPPAWREDLTLARRYLTEGGPSLVVRRLRSRYRRLRSEAVAEG